MKVTIDMMWPKGKSVKTVKSNLLSVDNKSIKLDSTSAFVQIAKYFDDHKINMINLSENKIVEKCLIPSPPPRI